MCPLSRLPNGRGVTALLDGEQVLVRRGDDGSLRAASNQPGEALEHDVRVRHGIVEVALPGIRVTELGCHDAPLQEKVPAAGAGAAMLGA